MKIKGLKINYVQYGNKKKKNLILLHGWGQNVGMMDLIGKKLESDCYITNIDLPGFGDSEEPKEAFTIYDYANIVKELLKELKIKDPIMVGHSLGGSVSIVYSSENAIDRLVLLGSPFKRKDRRNSFKSRFFKFLKKIPLLNKLEEFGKQLFGSSDYKRASKVMRDTLVNIVNEDISDNLYKIEKPTLLIWGSNDMAANIEDAKEAENKMKDAALIEYEGCGHYAYLEKLDQTVEVIKAFIK